MTSAYLIEFPDYPAADVPACLTAAGWADYSWHNDTCPYFVHEASGVGVWCGYADPELREEGRFTVSAMEWGADGRGGHCWSHDLYGESDLFVTDDADTLAGSLSNFIPARAIAHAFALAFETDYPEHLDTIRERNASADYAAPVCATHDFCDANMVMLEAFAAAMGRDARMNDDTPDGEAASQADFALMAAAWEIARAERLTATKEA